MSWWSWLLIWGLLGLSFVGMLVWFGFRLFHKAMAVSGALGELLEKTDLLDSRAEELRERFSPTVFDDPSPLVAARERQLAENDRRRQIRRETRVLRGKLLVRSRAGVLSFRVRGFSDRGS